jgi:hypothetical protein
MEVSLAGDFADTIEGVTIKRSLPVLKRTLLDTDQRTTNPPCLRLTPRVSLFSFSGLWSRILIIQGDQAFIKLERSSMHHPLSLVT